MQMNHEYDLAKLLASALKAKAPYVGIPMPGHAPLVLDRDKLSRGLKGVTPMHVEVQRCEDGTMRGLLIEGQAGPRVRTRMVLYAMNRNAYQVRARMWNWAKTERQRQIKAAALPTFEDRKAAAAFKKQATLLAKLQRELEKMSNPVWLRNPAVPVHTTRMSEGDYYRDIFKGIYGGKRLRTITGAIAAQAKRESWSSQRLYKHLQLRGIEVEKLSDMTPRERERRDADTFHSYLKNLWQFCHGTGRSYGRSYWDMVRGERSRGDGQQWGPARYMEKLADLQTRRSLQSQIDSVKAMMGRETPAPSAPSIPEQIAA